MAWVGVSARRLGEKRSSRHKACCMPTMRKIWRVDGLYPVVFLLVYSLCVTVMILQLTREQKRGEGDDSEPVITLRQVRVPGPYDDCLLTNMTADQIHVQQQQFRHHQISKYCDLCRSRTNTSKPDGNFSYCQDPVVGFKKLTSKNILVDDQSKILFCMVPKVASSNWKRALLKFRGNRNLTKDFNIHSRHDLREAGFSFLDLYPLEERQYRIKNYYKVMFVRNPLTRLVSAYKDKFTKNLSWSIFFQRKYGRAIIDKFRPNASEDERMSGRNITFVEFVRYIVDSYSAGRLPNVHWTPMYQLCRPCEISYDFVGKFETLEQDAQRAMGKVFGPGRACSVGFPADNMTPPMALKTVMQFYQALGHEVFSVLYGMFQSDFDLFGYEIQRIARTAQIMI